MFEEIRDTLSRYIEQTFEDDYRKPKNEDDPNRFSLRLNYKLTESFIKD
jgi:hypothetical protein